MMKKQCLTINKHCLTVSIWESIEYKTVNPNKYSYTIIILIYTTDVIHNIIGS